MAKDKQRHKRDEPHLCVILAKIVDCGRVAQVVDSAFSFYHPILGFGLLLLFLVTRRNLADLGLVDGAWLFGLVGHVSFSLIWYAEAVLEPAIASVLSQNLIHERVIRL